MTSGTITTGESRLHYLEDGFGSPVLVLHGFTGSAEAMAPLTGRLAAFHRVVAVDLVGHGGSSAPRSREACSMASVVSDLAGLLDALALDGVHLVGYSMGGRVALSFAVAHRTTVASIAVIGASSGIANDRERLDRAAADEALARRIEEAGLDWFVEYWSELPLLRPVSAEGAETSKRIRELRLGNDPAALVTVLRGLGAGSMPPVHDELAALDVPALLIAGVADEKYRAANAELAGTMPRARSVVIENAGHAAHLDNPTAVADMILSFLSAVEAEQNP